MPKDIRSYFVKTDGSTKKKDLHNSISPHQKGKSSKKRHVLSSDDEDDVVPPTPAADKPKKKLAEKRKLINPADVFGSEPVKQSTINVIKQKKKTQVDLLEQDFDFEWGELDNIEKQLNDSKSNDIPISPKKSPAKSNQITPKNSPAKYDTFRTPSVSPANKRHILATPKSSSNSNSTPNSSPRKTVQSTLIPQKTKSPSESPRKLGLENKTIKINIESPKKKLNFDDENIIGKSGSKRKMSPTKTPENKKIKISSVDSPDTQESGYTTESSPLQSVKSTIPTDNIESKLWVEKYKPLTLKQIIGQTGEKSNVNKLVNWLKSWYSNHGVGVNKKLTRPSPWAKDDNGAFFKAALLSGSPGVGKTTTAHLVCKELGFDIVEFNASDTRSKKQLQNNVSELLSSTSLSPFLGGKSVTKKHALLMDEVDGMAGNEDRGGVQELIILIKNAKCPVICMCNDRNHPKIRTLSNYCFDLRFHKPKLEQIKAAMMSICYKEKLKISPDTLSSIIASTDNDIRLTLNHLSVVAAGKDNLNINKKYIKMGPWDVVRKVFSAEEHKSMNITDKCDLFFYDYNISPLFVQENYLAAVPHNVEGSKWKTFERYSLAADSIRIGDIVSAKIRSTNNWSLLPAQAIFSSYCPGEFLRGHVSKQINFPAWLGKFSKGNKMNRLLQELQIHTRIRLSASKEAINLDYLTTLRNKILKPLIDEGSDGVHKSLDFMNHYHLVKDDVESLNELSSWPGHKDLMSDIPAKVKSAFTRAYNKSAPTFNVTKKNKKAVDDVEGLVDEHEIDDNISDEEEEDIANDALISIVKKKASKKAASPAPDKKIKNSGGSGRGKKKK
ncbi:replication factor C subunit 1 isoform X2 [Metopolophium dirhodum]|uniref:replication factor C subunit 1 isoform X2 n=1 Tax=Metopolophium dirhodum TaxID=44670 RepID=UPI00298F681D|nr:replication factor C subunit 1 isoform X2 [Metopolophium dirhodum]